MCVEMVVNVKDRGGIILSIGSFPQCLYEVPVLHERHSHAKNRNTHHTFTYNSHFFPCLFSYLTPGKRCFFYAMSARWIIKVLNVTLTVMLEGDTVAIKCLT